MRPSRLRLQAVDLRKSLMLMLRLNLTRGSSLKPLSSSMVLAPTQKVAFHSYGHLPKTIKTRIRRILICALLPSTLFKPTVCDSWVDINSVL